MAKQSNEDNNTQSGDPTTTPTKNNNDDYKSTVEDAQCMLAMHYGSAPLRPSDIVMVMQGWNKILAFKTAFSEALLVKWRYLVHPDTYSKKAEKRWRAMGKVERNEDILALCLGARLEDAEELVMGFLDGVFRSFCPKEQTVAREAYRPVHDDIVISRKREGDMTLECESIEDYTRLFARCGVEPHFWVFFCEAFLWTLKTHAPYAQDDDYDDLEQGVDSAYVKAIRIAALRAIDGYVDLRMQLEKDIFQIGVHRFWARLDHPTKMGFGELFYKSLLQKHPQMLDYFSKTDMDSLAIHFMATLDLLVKSIREIGSTGNFRHALDALGNVHRTKKIPTYSYPLVGGHLLDCLLPSFEAEEEATKNEEFPVTAKQMTQAFAVLYTDVMSIVYYPMLLEEKKVATAHDFYERIAPELNWNEKQLKRRLLQIEQEISSQGTYTQTSEEIQAGARLAWRNSAKCIGRISWNTLLVRDCRHVNDLEGMFQEINEHLKIATAGTNIQSVMTVFKPQSPRETLGTRFWSSQIVRYAAYKNLDGTITGDPANEDLTEYLLQNDLWEPPIPSSPFDVLPLVLKVPGVIQPYVYPIPPECVFEVNIEHPTRPEVLELGYKWTTVPAITNFKMNLGGVVYANIPFNGWFVSTEIVRNLMERYDAGPPMAKLLGIDTTTNPMWRQLAFCEWEIAVLHSFKKNGFTIVDPHSVGKSFCTHVRREREEFGRECPGQWSWIGGLTGSTNDTWHLEMRDFLVYPQYDYCMDGVVFYNSISSASSKLGPGSISEGGDESLTEATTDTSVTGMSSETSRIKVLIVYGSETGNAEAAARRMKRELILLKPTLQSLNELAGAVDSVSKRRFSHLLFVCSTFGKGSPPSNAEAFFAKDLSSRAFRGTKYAVLAVGSTLYPDFCQAGIKLDQKISKSGSTRLTPLEKVDDAAGGDGIILDWIGLIKRLVLPRHIEEEMMALRSLSAGTPPVYCLNWTGGKAAESPEATNSGNSLCLSNDELVTSQLEGSRSIRKITLQLPEGSNYETGDHLCVHPVHTKEFVDRFLKCFEFELRETALKQEHFPHPHDCTSEQALEWICQQRFEIFCVENNESELADVFFDTPASLRHLLSCKVDLSLSAKNVFDMLALFKKQLDGVEEKLKNDTTAKDVFLGCENVQKFYSLTAALFDKSSDSTTDAIDDFVSQYPTIVAFLEEFQDLFLEDFSAKTLGLKDSSVMVGLADVLLILPRLQPRYYSISSSSHTSNPGEASITVGVLKTTTSKGVLIEGVCSHYLANLKAGTDRANICVSKSSFRLPKMSHAPIMMVGTGTGLSPLLGFLEDKALEWKNSKDQVGPIHLFFGCRTEYDFIYRDVIKQHEDDKMINLHLALSRSDVVPKKYVQHRIVDMGKELATLLTFNQDTHYYVCGDAKMADECFEACITVLRKHSVMSRVAAVEHLKRMQLEGRWQTDVWGIVSHFEDSKRSIEKEKRTRAKLWLQRLAEGGEEFM